MRPIDVFIQGGEIAEILVSSAPPIQSVSKVLAGLDRPVAHGEGVLIFVEDMSVPIDPETTVEELLPLCSDAEEIAVPLRLHLTRCRHVEISVRFNGEQVARRFAPSATVARVHHWAARRAFGLSPRDAAEHVLQIHGTQKRPDRDIHIGSLSSGTTCAVAFDLVPRKRVEG